MANGTVKVLNDYFGRKPGQTLKDFAAEIQALSDDDKAELVELIEAQAA